MTDLKRIASAMGGEVAGEYAVFPTPGHSKKDRGSWAKLVPEAPDGVLVCSGNGGDPLQIKDELRVKGVLPERQRATGWRVTGTYEFRDEAGAVLYRTHRREHPTQAKQFRVERPDGKGGWLNGSAGVRRVLYRLPELLASDPAEPVYLVEGERKADKLAGWGLVATSIAFGCKSWRSEYAKQLASRAVVILPDNDDDGRAFAAKASSDIEAASGRAVIVDLPGLPPKGDVMDWGGDAAGLQDLAAAALAAPQSAPAAEKRPAYLNGISAAALMAKQFEPVNYVIPGLMAEGATLFAGKPKLGKSWLAYDCALALASGRAMFGKIPIRAGDVLYLALEDSERRLRSRLLKKGVTAPERLTLATQWPGLDDGCIAELDAWADSVELPTLVIIDVLKMVRAATRHNEGVYDADYRALSGLAQWGRGRGIAVLIVHHTRKMNADDPLEEISGTNGLTGAADTIWVLKRDIGTGNCTLYVRGRDVEEAEKAVRFRPDNGTWELLGDAEEVGRTDERQAILAALRDQPNPLSAREISDILGKSYDAVRKTLTRMAHAGELRKEGRGMYTCPSGPKVPTAPQTGHGTHGTGGVRASFTGTSRVVFPADDGWKGEPDDPAREMFG
jgi:hypothetical protein